MHQRLGLLGTAAVQAQRLQRCIPAAGLLDAEQRTRQAAGDLPHSFGRPPPLVHCPTPRKPEAHADQRMEQRPWEISTYNGRNPERREERCIAQSPLSPLGHSLLLPEPPEAGFDQSKDAECEQADRHRREHELTVGLFPQWR